MGQVPGQDTEGRAALHRIDYHPAERRREASPVPPVDGRGELIERLAPIAIVLVVLALLVAGVLARIR